MRIILTAAERAEINAAVWDGDEQSAAECARKYFGASRILEGENDYDRGSMFGSDALRWLLSHAEPEPADAHPAH